VTEPTRQNVTRGLLLGALGVAERSSGEAAALLRCPLAVVAGEDDPVTPLAEARAIAEKARTGRFLSVPLARHDDFSTLGRAHVAEAVAWLHAARR
jgi:pimeloyl-ACP methyl ester carboxylesterase